MGTRRDQRVRVAYFVPPSEHFAGIERVVHEIATGLAEGYGDRLDVHVLFSSSYNEDVLRSTPYTLHTLDVARLRNVVKTLRAVVAKHHFDVLICPQVEATVIAWLATRGLRLSLFISHLHGNPRIEEKEGSRRTRIAFALFRHVVSRRIAGLLAVSPSLGRYAAGSLTRHAQIYFAPNPVRDLGGAENRAIDGGHYRFVNVGRLCRQKGQDLLLRALAVARPDLPPVSLSLVGTGSDEGDLRRLCADLALDDIVSFEGYSSDPASHFRSADCFVLASRWEGFGVVLVEALQFGLPLVAADCEFGPSDIVTDPRIGELVAPDNVEALAEGLRHAVFGGLAQRDAAYRRAAAHHYDRAVAVPAHFEILQHIARSRPRRHARLEPLISATTTGANRQ